MKGKKKRGWGHIKRPKLQDLASRERLATPESAEQDPGRRLGLSGSRDSKIA